jgi:pimeloyl-ACP methyl ester carboxylesterase
MSEKLPNAMVLLYTGAGHGFIFQHIDDFSCQVLDFLC